MRLVFLGMPCTGSAIVLRALLAAGFDVGALVLAGEESGADGGGPAAVALAAGVPVVWVDERRRLSAAVAPVGDRLEAMVAACFPWRVPSVVRSRAPLGCLNVHPSLLPANRGPEPVFWTLRRGERRTGATVHLMDAGLDTGPIVAQAEVAVSPGVRAPDLEERLMALGAELVAGALPRLAAGELAPAPQDQALATAAPLPSAADWLVPTNLPAGWAYGFARGVAPLGGPLTVLVGATGDRLPVADAVDHHPTGRLDAPLLREEGGLARVRFRPGWVRFRLG